MLIALRTCFSKYSTFSGRASRSEYWYFGLFMFLVLCVAAVLDAAAKPLGSILWLLVLLVSFLPGLAVNVRRLHDIGRSGWWVLLSLVPIVGALVLLIFHCLPGTPGDNQYGPLPHRLEPALRPLA
jgi:uncharacterized membrane protein YhaH (DUF805 family)